MIDSMEKWICSLQGLSLSIDYTKWVELMGYVEDPTFEGKYYQPYSEFMKNPAYHVSLLNEVTKLRFYKHVNAYVEKVFPTPNSIDFVTGAKNGVRD